MHEIYQKACAMDVGLVGLGIMGSKIAAALAASDCRVYAFDVMPERRDEAARVEGVVAVTSLAEVRERSDIVLLSLPGPDQVAEVVAGPGGLLDSDSDLQVIVDLSTVDPMGTRHMAASAASRGIGYLDSPVLGRPSKCGSWTLPVGGALETLELARPILDVLATRVVHVGDAGNGNVIKLLNNLMFGAINAITVESMTIARQLGVDLQMFYDTIASSGAASVSNLFLEIGPKIVDGDTSPDFTLDLLQKDNRLAVEMAEAASVPTVVASAVTVLNRFGQHRGLGALDTSALMQLFDSDA